MATIYKRRETRPIPEGAAVVTFRGKPHAQWTDGRTGRTRRAPLDDTGTRIVQEAAKFTAMYFDEHGRRRQVSTGCSDRQTAQQVADGIERDVALRKRGHIDPVAEQLAQAGQVTITEHLAAYRAALQSAGRTANHVERTCKFIGEIADAARWAVVRDIGADGANTYAADLLAQGKAARTVQARLTAAKSFTRWLTTHGKLPRDPLASVRKPNPAADRRHERRMLLYEEWDWLRWTTRTEPARFNMTGPERVLLYAAAIQTGLRSGELRSLTRGRLFLEGAQPHIVCKARTTKNSKDCRQYIQPDLAAELAMHVATQAPASPVFRMPNETNVSRMFRADLQASRQAWLQASRGPDERLQRQQSDFLTPVNHDGERLDFHGLRHTCGAWLAMAGAHPKVVQTIMRHSQITLTMDTYGHLFPGQDAAAVAALRPMMSEPQGTPPALRVIGADGSPAKTGSISGSTQKSKRDKAGRDVANGTQGAGTRQGGVNR